MDPELVALVEDARSDPDLVALILFGSVAAGSASAESDIDVYVVRRSEPLPPRERRGRLELIPATLDKLRAAPDWLKPAIAYAKVLYDETGQAEQIVADAGAISRDETAELYDGYLNDLYRSLKAWRRGWELAARVECGRALRYVGDLLFALDGRRAPYPKEWAGKLGELEPLVLEVARTADPKLQQELCRRVVALASARGFDDVYDDWDGDIDRVLAFEFTGSVAPLEPAAPMIPPAMRGMKPEDVNALKGASDPRLSPDGSTVAYARWEIDAEENEYRGNIWFAPVDGSSPPRRFTTGEKRDGQPRWSPDGTRLAFTSSRAEKEPGQLFVLPVGGGGEAVRLTRLKEDVTDVVWSPDGTQIAFAARVRDDAYEHEEDDRRRAPRRITRLHYKLDSVGWTVDRRRQLFVVPADGSSEPRQLTEGEYENAQPTWSPDGKRIAFVSARTATWDTDLIEDLYVIAAEGGEPERLTDAKGSTGLPSWSPDGRAIAYTYSEDPYVWPQHSNIAVLDVETRERKVLTSSLDRQCAPHPDLREPAWDGDRIVFGIEDRGNVHLYSVPADGSAEPELLVGGEQTVRGFDVRGDTIVHVSTSATTFPDLFVGERKVTDTTADFPATLGEPERFTARSPDGSEVDAWIVRPAGFEEGKRYPLLLSIHGGPFTQYGTGFFDEFQVYAGAGYAVVYANPRGSSGYSEAWGQAIRGPAGDAGPGWGTVDYEDLMAVVDTALERFDFVDPERLGVIGGSYGGYMTSWIVSHTKRFKAAISERSVNNLYTAAGSSDLFWAFKGYFGSFAHEDVETWLKHSPAIYARDIETPLLILHSEDDLRCDVEQAEHLFITLRLLGKDVEFVRFPGESHELSRSGSPVHRVQRFEVILDWFDRYLR